MASKAEQRLTRDRYDTRHVFVKTKTYIPETPQERRAREERKAQEARRVRRERQDKFKKLIEADAW